MRGGRRLSSTFPIVYSTDGLDHYSLIVIRCSPTRRSSRSSLQLSPHGTKTVGCPNKSTRLTIRFAGYIRGRSPVLSNMDSRTAHSADQSARYLERHAIVKLWSFVVCRTVGFWLRAAELPTGPVYFQYLAGLPIGGPFANVHEPADGHG